MEVQFLGPNISAAIRLKMPFPLPWVPTSLPGEPRRSHALRGGTSARNAHRQRQRGGHLQSLVALRLKRLGARWKEESGQHILDLRALVLSDRWDAAMTLMLTQRRAQVRRAACSV